MIKIKNKKAALGVVAVLVASAVVMGGEVKEDSVCISFPSLSEPEPAPSAASLASVAPAAPAPSSSASKPASKDGGS